MFVIAITNYMFNILIAPLQFGRCLYCVYCIDCTMKVRIHA